MIIIYWIRKKRIILWMSFKIKYNKNELKNYQQKNNNK